MRLVLTGPIVRRRLAVCLAAFFVLFLVLTARLFYLQAIAAEDLQRRAQAQWTSESVIAPTRGGIYDRNGTALALSATAYTASASPRQVKDAQAFARALAPVLDMEESEIVRKSLGHLQGRRHHQAPVDARGGAAGQDDDARSDEESGAGRAFRPLPRRGEPPLLPDGRLRHAAAGAYDHRRRGAGGTGILAQRLSLRQGRQHPRGDRRQGPGSELRRARIRARRGRGQRHIDHRRLHTVLCRAGRARGHGGQQRQSACACW